MLLDFMRSHNLAVQTGLVYLRARPVWIRYSDYNQDPPLIVEFTQAELRF
jgi:hypothetical protein